MYLSKQYNRNKIWFSQAQWHVRNQNKGKSTVPQVRVGWPTGQTSLTIFTTPKQHFLFAHGKLHSTNTLALGSLLPGNDNIRLRHCRLKLWEDLCAYEGKQGLRVVLHVPPIAIQCQSSQRPGPCFYYTAAFSTLIC